MLQPEQPRRIHVQLVRQRPQAQAGQHSRCLGQNLDPQLAQAQRGCAQSLQVHRLGHQWASGQEVGHGRRVRAAAPGDRRLVQGAVSLHKRAVRADQEGNQGHLQ